MDPELEGRRVRVGESIPTRDRLSTGPIPMLMASTVWAVCPRLARGRIRATRAMEEGAGISALALRARDTFALTPARRLRTLAGLL